MPPRLTPRFRPTYADRREAGRTLASELVELETRTGWDLSECVVIALPRDGVPVGFEIARALGVPLDVTLVRKVGAPLDPELTVGAIGDDGRLILDGAAIAEHGINRAELASSVEAGRRELECRSERYRGNGEPIDVRGRTVLLVDDGIATGSTAIAAGRALRSRGAARVILAVPVGPLGVDRAFGSEFDAVMCPLQPSRFGRVGRWYRDFRATGDAEVIALLEDAEREPSLA